VNLEQYQDRYLPMLEQELRKALGRDASLPEYYGMMEYHMGWRDATLNAINARQGKRIRPMLCMLACEAVGGCVTHSLPAAAAIELVHNFSLLHDDIEDNSETRRGRPTVWKVWGIAHGINSGDGMYAIAFLTMSGLIRSGVPADRALAAVQMFAETCLALTEGQYQDLKLETELAVNQKSYLAMIRNKTAALIACSAGLGALLGGAEADVVTAYAEFGENLGLAFQVIDDILGIWGLEQQTGKSASSDILTRKKTLPVVYALDDPKLRSIYHQERLTEADVPHVVELLERRGARQYAEEMGRAYSERAMQHLDRAGSDSPARRAMREYALSLLRRTY